MKRNLKNILFTLLHLIGFVILFFIIRNLDWDAFLRAFKTFPAWKYGVGLLILLLVYLSKSYRWHILNRAFMIHTTWKDAFIFYLSAGFLSVITPGRLGEFAKIYFLRKKYDTDMASSTSSVILDRIWDVLVLSSIAGISLIVLLFSQMNLPAVVLIGLLFILSLSVILFPGILFVPLLFFVKKRFSFHESLERIFLLWKQNRFKNFFAAFTISLLAFLSLAFIPFLFSLGNGYPITYPAGIASISISNILSFIPITIAGFGTRELVFTEVWARFGYPGEIALSVSIAYFMVTYLGSLLIGGIVYATQLRKFYRIREIGRVRAP
ncbi:MAG: flippase-like domain-containing protein [Bacteroidales bacterium]|nr:flippase-like domain-containing protein [Bacteroidales bacterium]MBN2698109.1 flippase-like domain-containing protein [Bacteroidales bacterium]